MKKKIKIKINGFIDFWILNLRKGILFLSDGHVSVLFEFNSRRRVMNENSLVTAQNDLC